MKTGILVTGGAGYIGSHACKALAACGYTPVTLDNLVNGRRELVRWGPFVRGDLADVALVRRAISEHRVQAVMHFAGYAAVGESMRAPGKYFENNFGATLALLEAMRAEGVRDIVFSSSCATYGVPREVPITEAHPQTPVNPYGESKLFAERLLEWYAAAHGLRYAALRYFNAAGADADGDTGEDHDQETRLIPLAIDAALGASASLAIYGTDYPTPDGTAIRDYVHVTDLADAHVLALEQLAAGTPRLALNLGTGSGQSVREVVRMVEEVGGRPVPVIESPRREGDPPELVAATGMAAELLGWTPRHSDLRNIIATAWSWQAKLRRRELPVAAALSCDLPGSRMTTPLSLYDNYTRSLRPFEPLHPGAEVGLYTCGPTVYDYQHIGNFRTFLFEDLLKRVLEWNGYRVRHVMNITDVGHLTSDADTGEDKMEKGSRRTGKTAWEIAEMYTESFVTDMHALAIEDPTVLCRATDHITEQIAFIADIEKKGFTYRTSDGIYFDTSRQPDYGYLARLDVKGLEAGKRVDLGEKRNPTDFALWKFSPAGEQRQMEWDSPWGRGFPGWHIECSAMAQKYLGDYFDIHCGGEDHIPVHHTNEIAQTEARVGTRLANFWLHGYFLLLADAKMAKSAGEFLRVQSLVDRGYDPLAYRYLCLTGHYRGQLNFTWDALDAAATALDRVRNAIYALRTDPATRPADPDAALTTRFTGEINDDLNLPRALAVAWETLRGDLPGPVRLATLLAFDRVFGLRLATWEPPVEAVPDAVTALAEARAAARAAKNWAEADRLRGEIHAAGWEMEDRAGGYALKKM